MLMSIALSLTLPAGTAFVDVCRYHRVTQSPEIAGKAGQVWTPCYLAFVLRSGEGAERVELGEAEPIEAACAAWRRAVAGGLPDRPEAAEVRRLVWEPLGAAVRDAHTVWLAPDGVLSLVPLSALPGPRPDSILLESVALAFVPDGDYLLHQLRLEADQPPSGGVVVVGGIDYAGDDGVGAAGADRPHGDLAWSAHEQWLVAGLARDALVAEPVCLGGTEATAAAVLASLPSARYVHIAAHGFALGDSSPTGVEPGETGLRPDEDGHRQGAAARNPLSLSGVALSTREAGDAFLSGEAIAAADLSRMDLAVLSACGTGLGEALRGEGVFGLPRAFHLGGCRDVVASLWDVDDEDACALMAKFYRHLWRDRLAPLDALRAAQLHLFRHPQDAVGGSNRRGLRPGAAKLPTAPAPRRLAATARWAGFVLSGPGVAGRSAVES